MNAAIIGRRRQATPIDRAALAVGTALVRWSQRRRRAVVVDREILELRRAAAREVEYITARRDLGIHQLWR